MDIAAAVVTGVDSARSIVLGDGDVLVHEGDEGDDVYQLVSGELRATTSSANGDVIVGSVAPGQVIGEVVVIAGGRRTATLRSVGDSEALVFGRMEFETWLAANPGIADAVSAQARERIDRTHVASMVSELLGADDPSLIQEIVDNVEWRRLGAGDLLFAEGDPSDSAYFIVGGRLMVSIRSSTGEDERIGELGRGDVVGELGLLEDAPRSATVRAVRDSTLATLRSATFEQLVMKSPALMLHVARGVISRLRAQPRRAGTASSITVAVTAGVDAEELSASLAAAIGRFGSVRHLSSSRVDRYLNRDDISQADVENVGVPRLTEFMHEADVGSDHVVLQADATVTGWTRRALRHADRVLLVVSARPDAAERAHVADLLAVLHDLPHVRRMLVVVHPVGTDRPRNTARLLVDIPADEVVHLRVGSPDDIGRVARLASGHGVGLVLGGGGARGFAHLGAIRALRESGVPIDAVGGCSMGAPIAGGVALDLDDDALIELAERSFHRLLDYTVPVVALLKGERISNNIGLSFGDWDIEDLWLPYYCVSTNLTRSMLEVHRRGSAAQAIRASVAIPGVLPPVPVDGDLLVDGGVLNNLPAETMRLDSTIGTVIAVDVAPRHGPRARADFGTSVSGFRALRSTIGRAPSEYPSVTSVLLRSMLTGAVHNQERSLRDGVVDLMVEMQLRGVGLLEFERIHEVSTFGYDDSIDAIAAWASTQPWIGSAS